MPAASATRIAMEVRWMASPLQNGRSRTIVITLAAFAAIAIAGTSIALGAAHRHVVNPDTTVSYTASTTGPVVQGIQNGTGQGVEGLVGASAGGIGILGFATDLVHAEVALEGLAWGPSSVGLYGQGLKNADTTHPTVGLLGTSTSGVGVEGQSLVATGTGVYGIASDGASSGSLGVGGGSGVLGNTSRGNLLHPGVDGESSTGSGDAGGAFGLNIFLPGHVPTYGVLSYGVQNAFFGVASGSGASSTNAGVYGTESGGGSSFPDLNAGVFGSDTYGTAILAEGGGTTPTFRGQSFPVGIYAVNGTSLTGAGLAVTEYLEVADAKTYALYAVNSAANENASILPSGTYLMTGNGTGGGYSFDVNGNEILSGLITTAGSCSIGCSQPHTPLGKRVITYADQTSEPSVEDFGEGQVVAGVGHVNLDPAFARTINANARYIVFLTPEGDTRGLYVTQRTPTGFTVRESQGGSSTLGFAYRVVAKPYGVAAARLPMVDLTHRPSPLDVHGRIVPQPLDPYAALVKAVGSQRAAQLLAQFRADHDQRSRMLNALPHSDANGTLHLGSTTVAPRTIHN
jgi:hypothetical protein